MAMSFHIFANVLQLKRMTKSATVGQAFNHDVECGCTDCDITDIVCHGENMMSTGRITVLKRSNLLVSFNFPSFEDANACVYMVKFIKEEKHYYNILAVIENDFVTVKVPPPTPPPAEGDQFEKEVDYTCTQDCPVEKVMLNGVPLITQTRRSSVGSIPFYVLGENKVILRITEFLPILLGVEQAVFMVDGEPITKTLMEIGDKSDSNDSPASTEGTDGTTEDSSAAATTAGSDDSSSAASADPAGSDNPAGEETTEEAVTEAAAE